MADIAELIVALKLRDGVSPGLGRLNGQLRGMQGGLSDVGRGIGQVGRGLDTVITRGAIAAAAGLGAVVTTAASFEQAFTGVEKTVGGTDIQLGELEETLRGMARTMPIAFEELAAIGEAGGALGVARDSLDEFVDVVARLSVSTDLSADQAATALGQLGNVLQLTGDEYESFSDILVALGNDGASTESQIIDLAARFGAAGNAAGLTNEQILTLASTTASMGIEAEAGGGALSRVFNNLTLDMATASDEGQLLADTLGVSLDELKQAWEQDAGGVFEDLLAHINKLDQFEGAAFLSDLGITNTRDINAIRLLSQGIEEYRGQLETATTASGALDEESQKFFDTTAGQWKILQNNVRDAAATLGSELLPVVNEVMGDFVDFLQEPGTQQGLKDFARDLASGVKDLVTEVRNADFGPLLDTMQGAATIAKGAFDAFRSLPQPIQQLALAAIVANKVTGGAVGQIAGGLGSILKGIIKIGFERGSSPANPLFVSATGGLGGGGGVGAAGRGGVGRLLGGGFAVLTAAALAQEFEEEITGFAGDLHDSFLKDNPLAGFSPNELEWPFGPKNAPDWATFEDDRPTKTFFDPGPKPTSAADGSFDRFGEKLDKLATNEVLEHLARTTEVGLKDVGTSFQTGLTTGLDPVGDIATRILARAEDPKAPAVMTEIQGHIAGLEEIQATYLSTGDVPLAAKVQTNIDTLNRLIGSTDLHRQVTQYLSDQAASSDAAMLSTAQQQTGRLDTANARLLAIEQKRSTVNVTVNTNTNVSVSAAQMAQGIYSITNTITGNQQIDEILQ